MKWVVVLWGVLVGGFFVGLGVFGVWGVFCDKFFVGFFGF